MGAGMTEPYEPLPGERWRTGTSPGTDGRTIYRHLPGGPVRGELIGVMFSREMAALVRDAVNDYLIAIDRRRESEENADA